MEVLERLGVRRGQKRDSSEILQIRVSSMGQLLLERESRFLSWAMTLEKGGNRDTLQTCNKMVDREWRHVRIHSVDIIYALICINSGQRSWGPIVYFC